MGLTNAYDPTKEAANAFGDADGEHMMGTTIMAVTFEGGVILGADSRTSTGSYVANRVSDKITEVSENVYCCRSGSAADTQAIAAIVKYYLTTHKIEQGTQPLVKTAATMFRDMCYDNKNQLSAGIIVGGYDELKGGQVFSIPLGGTLIEQDVALGGSGSTYIQGYCDAQYKPGMSQADCEKFVKTAISHAMARDGSSGGVIRLCVITKKGVERKFTPGDKVPWRVEA